VGVVQLGLGNIGQTGSVEPKKSKKGKNQGRVSENGAIQKATKAKAKELDIDAAIRSVAHVDDEFATGLTEVGRVLDMRLKKVKEEIKKKRKRSLRGQRPRRRIW